MADLGWDHATIWLQPWCNGCDKHAFGVDSGRQWCEDEVWDDCEECGAKPVKYSIEAAQPEYLSGCQLRGPGECQKEGKCMSASCVNYGKEII
jgi:hypothetical protein